MPDRIVRSLLEERLELGGRLASRQPADVDAGDVRASGELAARAGEGQPDEHGEQRRNGGADGEERRCRERATTSARPRVER